MYADDIVIICEDQLVLKVVMKRIEEVTSKYGLNISVKKTKALTTNSNECSSDRVKIVLGNEEVENVDEFVYLGSVMTSRGTSEKDVVGRINLGQ